MSNKENTFLLRTTKERL